MENFSLSISTQSKYRTPILSTKPPSVNNSRLGNQSSFSRLSSRKRVLKRRSISRTEGKEGFKDFSTSRMDDDQQIPIDVATEIVRQYLLPLFSGKTPVKRTPQMSKLQTLSDSSSPFQQLNGTVYGELKLSDTLMTQLEDVIEATDVIRQKIKDQEQEKIAAQRELELIQKQRKSLQQTLLQGNNELNTALSAHQQELHKITQTEHHYSAYKKLAQSTRQQFRQYKTMLHDEKAINDKRRNTAAELKNGNNLLQLENDIIDERLLELYDQLNSILKKKFAVEDLTYKITIIAFNLRDLAQVTARVRTELAKANANVTEMEMDSSEVRSLLDETIGIRDKLANAAKDSINKLQTQFITLVEERDAMKEKLSTLEKVHREVLEELSKLRKKLKQYRQFRGESDEKHCRNCNRVYIENENFNWSCRTHLGQYSGEMYWCCGKTSKDALGCHVSKHDPKDDEEDEMDQHEEEKNKQVTMLCSVTFYTELPIGGT